MKRFCKVFACWVFVLLLVFSPSMQSHASLESLLIQTDSNALMTLELDDSDYAVIPMSSITSVNNTIDRSGVTVIGIGRTADGGTIYQNTYLDSDGRFRLSKEEFSSIAYYSGFVVRMGQASLPPSGTYRANFDFGSDFAFQYRSVVVASNKYIKNAESLYSDKVVSYTDSSGDLYSSNVFKILNSNYLDYVIFFLDTNQAQFISGVLNIGFTLTDEVPDYDLVGNGSVSDDVQNEISSSLSDLSSSMDNVSEEIGFVAEAIQNLQGAMEPHYSNVLTQLHHITEQLHAFYDQIYNNIHLKEYALWQDIKTVIENIDLEVNVNLDKLKTSIDNMSTAVQNKLQSVTDTITGGFDNTGIEQNGNELDSSITEFEEAEQNVLESVNDSLNDFEFNADLSEYKNIVQVISDFLQELYDSSGGFKLVINLSLMLSVASIVIGVYRFKEGG